MVRQVFLTLFQALQLPIKWIFSINFGDAYKTLDLIDAKLPDFTATSLYFPIILATVVFASLLLAMIIMGILTIVRYYFYVTKKSKKDHYSMVIATYFLYIFGVLMFFVLIIAYTV